MDNQDQPTLEQGVQLQNDIKGLESQRVHQQDIVPGAIKPKHLAPATRQANGDLYYSDGTNFIRVPIGTTNQVLNATSTGPSWHDNYAKGLMTNTGNVTTNGATAPTVGQVLTATSSTAANWQSPSFSSRFSVYNSTAQTMTHNAITQVSFDTILFDGLTEYSAVSHNFTATTTGIYLFGFGLNTSGGQTSQHFFYKNGVQVATSGVNRANAGQFQTAITLFSLTASDTIDCRVFNESGVTDYNLSSNPGYTYFFGYRIA
jgi:hypothetical protein